MILAEELGIRYELVMVDSSDLKKEPYESKNPNGRVPAVDDPNNNITVWEVSRENESCKCLATS